MRFQVPQFIGVEDKVFGPFTVKQFVYLAGGAGISYIIYRFLPLPVAIILIAPVATLALALAFGQVNGKPFVFTLEAAIKYYMGTKLYLWRKEKKEYPAQPKNNEAPEPVELNIPRLSESKLQDITWKLEVEKK